MGLDHAVVTVVARDDLADGGAAAFAATIAAIRRRRPGDARRGPDPRLQGRRRTRSATIFAARPDVLNHNVETVPRLQRAVRPSAVLRPQPRACSPGPTTAGLTTKSSIIVGHGRDGRRGRRDHGRPRRDRRRHRHDRPVPAADHRPPARRPVVVTRRAVRAGPVGPTSWASRHVEAGPLTRSSYHAARRPTGSGRSGPSRQVDAGRTGRPPRRATLTPCSTATGAAARGDGRAGLDASCCRSAPTCRTSPGTRPCRSNGSRCWWFPATARPTRDPAPRGAAGRAARRRVRARALGRDRRSDRHRRRPRRPGAVGRDRRPDLVPVPRRADRTSARHPVRSAPAR